MDIYHVFPLNDTFDHEFDQCSCPCQPTIKVEAAPWDYRSYIVILHKSFDKTRIPTERGMA